MASPLATPWPPSDDLPLCPRTAMSVAFRSSKRRRRLMEAMVLLRDWPLVLVIFLANFLTNIIAWGPMPPVVEKHSGARAVLK